VSDLAAFLAARLDEDEWIAQGAARTDDGHGGQWLPVHFGAGGFDARVDDHIARHDPARTLREVEAGRALLADHEGTRAITGDDDEYVSGLAFAIRALASAWSDHPDYREEWKP
jgi:hypothetical protein